MSAALAYAACELAIVRRNRLALAAAAMTALFAGALTLLGAGATGALGVDLLTAAGASLGTLLVYLIPLIALLLSFDAVAGEIERGALGLLLAQPAPRLALLGGKLMAHLAALAAALALGCLVALAVAWAADGPPDRAALRMLAKLWASGALLGAAFLGIGYALSARARQPAAAAGYAIAVWLVCVVLYDVALLAGLIADQGGAFSKNVFPWLVAANPADAFRLVNLPQGAAAELASGFAQAGASIGAAPLASLLLWPLLALALAWLSFRRVEP